MKGVVVEEEGGGRRFETSSTTRCTGPPEKGKKWYGWAPSKFMYIQQEQL
jgi:hypothetical protein